MQLIRPRLQRGGMLHRLLSGPLQTRVVAGSSTGGRGWGTLSQGGDAIRRTTLLYNWVWKTGRCPLISAPYPANKAIWNVASRDQGYFAPPLQSFSLFLSYATPQIKAAARRDAAQNAERPIAPRSPEFGETMAEGRNRRQSTFYAASLPRHWRCRGQAPCTEPADKAPPRGSRELPEKDVVL